MRYLTDSHTMKSVDACSIQEFGIPSVVLMERAALGVSAFLRKIIAENTRQESSIKVVCVCGSDGRVIKEGIKTVIVGKPNAGKSSLLNVLAGHERAIVTDIEGTTRDVLEETIKLGVLNLNVVDTAGIRQTEDLIEKIGVDKALEYAETADLIIYVVDASRSLDENDEKIINMISDKKSIVLLNKSDIDTVISAEHIKEKVSNIPIISISAKEERGIKDLEDKVKEMFLKGDISFNDQVYISNVRQKNALLEALESMKKVIRSIDDNMPEDFYSIDLMDAYESLGYITGNSVGEDLINEIFSKFCIKRRTNHGTDRNPCCG